MKGERLTAVADAQLPFLFANGSKPQNVLYQKGLHS